MAFLSGLDIAVSGMMAQRIRSEIITQNVSNATTTRTEDGTPYVRKIAVFAENVKYKNIDTGRKPEFGSVLGLTLAERREKRLAGVQVLEIVDDPTPLKPVYDPTHPDADEDGYYYLPNVDVAEEQYDMLAATRSYEANLNLLEAMINMANKALTIGK